MCGSLVEASAREWLVTDGLGGFAMGTIGGLATRRYHGLLVVATEPPIGRRMGLVALDPTLVIGDRRIRLSTHEWAGGGTPVVDPMGVDHLESFEVEDGLPCWRWAIEDLLLERRVAMLNGRPAVGIEDRLLSATTRRRVRLELDVLCTWRDVHGERFAGGDPWVEHLADGLVFEGAYRVRGDGFQPAGEWYRGVYHREEAARGLQAGEDVWLGGRFSRDLVAGDCIDVTAWAGPDLGDGAAPPPARAIVAAAADRSRMLAQRLPGDADHVERALALAADQFVVTGAGGPTVVAGYPWFGDWSRDTMTSYEGLFLSTGRENEGHALLAHAATLLDQGMLANTADAGGTEYNTIDGTLWFVHAVGRHVEVTGNTAFGIELLPALLGVVEHHVAGTRFGIRVDPADGLVTGGADGWALTWMDARVDGFPITPRWGKPVEINALWIRALSVIATLVGSSATARGEVARIDALEQQARASFLRRYPSGLDDGRLFDVVDGPDGDDDSLRPNQLLAVSLPGGPLHGAAHRSLAAGVVASCAPLLTSLGPRSLGPDDPRYTGSHRGSGADRDHAYHQGTVWPWVLGPWVDAAIHTGLARAVVEARVAAIADHLGEWGIGSVSETADGAAPHDATGCPFQAWSVAEVLRVLRLVRDRIGG